MDIRPIRTENDHLAALSEIESLMEAEAGTPEGGRLNRVYEVLNRTRPLTLRMIRRLHKDLGIPAESLIGVIEG